jgi:hypothetical protein
MHAGQITFITKMLTGRALDFEHDWQGVVQNVPPLDTRH